MTRDNFEKQTLCVSDSNISFSRAGFTFQGAARLATTRAVSTNRRRRSSRRPRPKRGRDSACRARAHSTPCRSVCVCVCGHQFQHGIYVFTKLEKRRKKHVCGKMCGIFQAAEVAAKRAIARATDGAGEMSVCELQAVLEAVRACRKASSRADTVSQCKAASGVKGHRNGIFHRLFSRLFHRRNAPRTAHLCGVRSVVAFVYFFLAKKESLWKTHDSCERAEPCALFRNSRSGDSLRAEGLLPEPQIPKPLTCGECSTFAVGLFFKTVPNPKGRF